MANLCHTCSQTYLSRYALYRKVKLWSLLQVHKQIFTDTGVSSQAKELKG